VLRQPAFELPNGEGCCKAALFMAIYASQNDISLRVIFFARKATLLLLEEYTAVNESDFFSLLAKS
jgi:hypothetical protein